MPGSNPSLRQISSYLFSWACSSVSAASWNTAHE